MQDERRLTRSGSRKTENEKTEPAEDLAAGSGEEAPKHKPRRTEKTESKANMKMRFEGQIRDLQHSLNEFKERSTSLEARLAEATAAHETDLEKLRHEHQSQIDTYQRALQEAETKYSSEKTKLLEQIAEVLQEQKKLEKNFTRVVTLHEEALRMCTNERTAKVAAQKEVEEANQQLATQSGKVPTVTDRHPAIRPTHAPFFGYLPQDQLRDIEQEIELLREADRARRVKLFRAETYQKRFKSALAQMDQSTDPTYEELTDALELILHGVTQDTVEDWAPVKKLTKELSLYFGQDLTSILYASKAVSIFNEWREARGITVAIDREGIYYPGCDPNGPYWDTDDTMNMETDVPADADQELQQEPAEAQGIIPAAKPGSTQTDPDDLKGKGKRRLMSTGDDEEPETTECQSTPDSRFSGLALSSTKKRTKLIGVFNGSDDGNEGEDGAVKMVL
ncbi:hypothetical protein HDV00_007060 [Rhizophlyctis rosea]|nr:hypothetical protein HDV00_007060 [Rhizophlyctis rosea]